LGAYGLNAVAESSFVQLCDLILFRLPKRAGTRLDARLMSSVAAGVLVGSAVARYALKEWWIHRSVTILGQPLYWLDLAQAVALPLALCAVWLFLSPQPRCVALLAATAATLLLLDAIIFTAARCAGPCANHLVAQSWHARRYCAAAIYGGAIVILAASVASKKRRSGRKAFRLGGLGGRLTLARCSILSACAGLCVLMIAWLYRGFVLPGMRVQPWAVSEAKAWLVEPRFADDFQYLLATRDWSDYPLRGLVDGIGLAERERNHFYGNVDTDLFRRYVLNPAVVSTEQSGLSWRRQLWERLSPIVRQETKPARAAGLVVKALSLQIGIDASYPDDAGVETVWVQGVANERAWERALVAAFRAIGLAARLNAQQQAEYWNGETWALAPSPSIPVL
jgi:hypothetical protein